MDGIDVANVTSWFDRHLGGVTPPLHFELIAGGRAVLDGAAWRTFGESVVRLADAARAPAEGVA